jgi:hypothetical protein
MTLYMQQMGMQQTGGKLAALNMPGLDHIRRGDFYAAGALLQGGPPG